MSTTTGNSFKGVIRGKTIELAEAPDMPDGQEVVVMVQVRGSTPVPPGEGLRRAFGACADEAGEVDTFIKEYRELRQLERPDIEP